MAGRGGGRRGGGDLADAKGVAAAVGAKARLNDAEKKWNEKER